MTRSRKTFFFTERYPVANAQSQISLGLSIMPYRSLPRPLPSSHTRSLATSPGSCVTTSRTERTTPFGLSPHTCEGTKNSLPTNHPAATRNSGGKGRAVFQQSYKANFSSRIEVDEERKERKRKGKHRTVIIQELISIKTQRGGSYRGFLSNS